MPMEYQKYAGASTAKDAGIVVQTKPAETCGPAPPGGMGTGALDVGIAPSGGRKPPPLWRG